MGLELLQKYWQNIPGACPQPPSLRHIIYGLTGFYLGATTLKYEY